MDTQDKKHWTDEQFVKYFVNGVVNVEDIRSWTCEQLVEYVYHFLNQKSAIAHSFLEVLLRENAYGFASEKQKEILIELHTEVKAIRALTDMLRIWHSGGDE